MPPFVQPQRNSNLVVGRLISSKRASQLGLDKLVSSGYQVRNHIDDYRVERFLVYKGNQFIRVLEHPIDISGFNLFTSSVATSEVEEIKEEPESSSEEKTETETESAEEDGFGDSTDSTEVENEDADGSAEDSIESETETELADPVVGEIESLLDSGGVADVNSRLDQAKESGDIQFIQIAKQVESENKDRSGVLNYIDHLLEGVDE